MRREKFVISLVVMFVLLFVFAINAFATAEPLQITTITAGNTSNTSNSAGTSGTPTTITPSSNTGIVPLTTGNTAKAGATNGATQISTGNSATNNAATTSSYKNVASNTNNKGLPYTGSSYGIVFVIFALVVSAIYAYKKVSDYNM